MAADSDWVDDIPSHDDGWIDDAPLQKENPAMSAVRGLAQGVSGGFSDEIHGAFEGAGRAAGLKGLGGPIKDIGLSDEGPTADWKIIKEAYKRARDHEREMLNKDSQDNPGTAFTTQLAGAMVSPVNKVMPSGLVSGGATLGAVQGAGNSEAADLTGLAKDTAFGGLVGGVVGKGVEVASPTIAKSAKYAGDKLKGGAESLMARALGAERGTIKKMGIDKVRAAGRYALDEGLPSPLANTEDLIARNAAKMDEGGKMMGKAYDAIDDAGASTFNPLEVASKVDNQIGGFYRSPINRGETNQLENTLESILMRGEGNIPIKEAQALKEELQKVANWKNTLNPTDKEKMARQAYGIVSSEIDSAIQNASGVVDSAGLAETLKQGKKLFSNAKTAEGLLENKLAREQGNKMFGLTDAITGGAALGYGGVTDDWGTAAGIMAGKKALGKYGAQNAAMLADKISKTLLKSPQMQNIYQKSPAAFQYIVNQVERRMIPGAQKAASTEDQKPKFVEEHVSHDEAKQAFLNGN